MQKTKIALFICSVFVIPSFAVYAQESSETNEADTLETIVVSETSFSQQIGTQKITEKEMERRPTTNGNITDLLKINPNVRFSGESDASNNGGEISPSEVKNSITTITLSMACPITIILTRAVPQEIWQTNNLPEPIRTICQQGDAVFLD